MWQAGLVALVLVSQIQIQPAGELPNDASMEVRPHTLNESLTQAFEAAPWVPLTTTSVGTDPTLSSVVEPVQTSGPQAAPVDSSLLPATSLTSTWLPQLDSRGFGIGSLDLRHTLLMGYDDLPALSLTPGAAMHQWSGPRSLDLPARVYDTYLDVQWLPWSSDKSNLMVGATPGFYGDFERIDRKTFQWSGWLMGTHRLGPQWALAGGVAYLRQLKSNWLPLGGAIWSPTDTTRVELIFPKPRIATRVHQGDRYTHWAYVTGQYGGGAWAVADTPSENVLIGYSDLRLLIGWEAYSRDGFQWHTEFGYVFDRQVSVNGFALETPSDTILAQFGLAF